MPCDGWGRALAVWLFVVAGQGTEGSLSEGSDLPTPGILRVEGLLFVSSKRSQLWLGKRLRAPRLA